MTFSKHRSSQFQGFELLSACEYKGKCYSIDSDWLDMEDCMRLYCKRDDEEGNAYIVPDYYGQWYMYLNPKIEDIQMCMA